MERKEDKIEEYLKLILESNRMLLIMAGRWHDENGFNPKSKERFFKMAEKIGDFQIENEDQ